MKVLEGAVAQYLHQDTVEPSGWPLLKAVRVLQNWQEGWLSLRKGPKDGQVTWSDG